MARSPSAAAAAAPVLNDEVPAPAVPSRWRGKKKLLLLGAGALLLLLALGGSAAWWFGRADAAAAPAEGADAAATDEAASGDEPLPRRERSGPPTFVPLDPFTVNLADRDTERYAQIGITLELEAPQDTETIKQYMPAIRNNVLMVLAHKSAAELLEREGKLKLADEVRREALRALDHDDGDGPPRVRAVQFSNFIVQ
jgi:flagellar FliL protein